MKVRIKVNRKPKPGYVIAGFGRITRLTSFVDCATVFDNVHDAQIYIETHTFKGIPEIIPA